MNQRDGLNSRWFILPVMAALVVASHGVTYSVTNGSGANGSGIADSAGRAYQNSANPAFAGPGTVAIGYFPALSDSAIVALPQHEVPGAFAQFGTSGTFSAPGPQDVRGLFTISTSGTVTGTSFANQPIYVLVGSGTSFATSCEILILKTLRLFDPALDATVVPESVGITVANTIVFLGSAIPNLATTGSDPTVTPGWQTTFRLDGGPCIPEPSTALLGLIAAVSLVCRRRTA